MNANIKDLENKLWEAADHMRANSPLRLNEFAEPVLGLIFLKFAGIKYSKTEKELVEEKEKKTKNSSGTLILRERPISSTDYHARGALYVPKKSRFSYLIELPEGADMGKAVNDAVEDIEAENKELAGILPKTFQKLDNQTIIAKMNLAIHGLSGDIREGNTYYEDRHKSVGKFDFTMANPPFNVKGVDKERIKDDPRFSYGIPRADNGNYLWIQIFLNSLNEKGRAGFVMANSASDAGHSEKEIRQKLVESGAVDVMVAVGPNMFYNVTLPVTLWFLDKGKKKTERKNKILFIDARNIYRQIDRAHRDWTDEQIEQIANIARSYRGEKGVKKYSDIKGFCKVATIEEIKRAGYSLNPGRYVGVANSSNGDGENFT